MRVSDFIKSLFTTKKFFILLLVVVLLGISVPILGIPVKYVIFAILGIFILALLIVLFSPSESSGSGSGGKVSTGEAPEAVKTSHKKSEPNPVVPEDSDIADLSYMKDLSLVLYRINFTDEDLKKDILKYKFFLDKYLNSLSDDDVIDSNLANSLKALAALCNVYIESENKVSESKQFGEEVPDFVTQTLRETLEKIKVQLQKNIEEITAFSSTKT